MVPGVCAFYQQRLAMIFLGKQYTGPTISKVCLMSIPISAPEQMLLATFVLTLLAVTSVSGHGPQTGVSVPDPTRLLLQANARWSRDFTKLDPTFFKNLARGQDPKV